MGYLVNKSTFTPFTYDELVKPIEAYTKAYNEAADKYNASQMVVNQAMSKIDKNTDPTAYEKYQGFLDNVNKQAEDIVKNGLNPSYQQNLRDLNVTYSKDIYPIDVQVKKKTDYAQTYRDALNTSGEVIGINPDNLSIDIMVRNPDTPLPIFPGKVVKEDFANYFDKFTLSPELFGNSLTDKSINKVYSTLMVQYGISAQDFPTIFQQVSALKNVSDEEKRLFLNTITDKAVDAEVSKLNVDGYPNISEEVRQNLKDQIRNYANSEQYKVIGKTQITPQATGEGLRAGAARTTVNITNALERKNKTTATSPSTAGVADFVNAGVFADNAILAPQTRQTVNNKQKKFSIDQAYVNVGVNNNIPISMFGKNGTNRYFYSEAQFKNSLEPPKVKLKSKDKQHALNQYYVISNLLHAPDLDLGSVLQKQMSKYDMEAAINSKLQTPLGRMYTGVSNLPSIIIENAGSSGNAQARKYIKGKDVESLTVYNYSNHGGKQRWYGENSDAKTKPIRLDPTSEAVITDVSISPVAQCISFIISDTNGKDGAQTTKRYLLRFDALKDKTTINALSQLSQKYKETLQSLYQANKRNDPQTAAALQQDLTDISVQIKTAATREIFGTTDAAQTNQNNSSNTSSTETRYTTTLKQSSEGD